MIMFLCLRWWYSAGWQWIWQTVLVERCTWIMETFSTTDLLRTLFAPFRQTYAGKIKGPLDVQIRAFFDRLISRAIGFIVRTFLIIMAAVALLLVIIIAIVTLLIWPLIPILPALSIVLFMMGAGK